MSRSLILKRFSAFARSDFLLQNKGNLTRQVITRKSHGGEIYYRKVPPLEPPKQKFCIFIGALTWWWIFWHIFTEGHHLLGHTYPDPSKWTDEELGIPED